jgi:hypothetical protein
MLPFPSVFFMYPLHSATRIERIFLPPLALQHQLSDRAGAPLTTLGVGRRRGTAKLSLHARYSEEVSPINAYAAMLTYKLWIQLLVID